MILLIFNIYVNYAYYAIRRRPPGWLASTVGETAGLLNGTVSGAAIAGYLLPLSMP